jgi:hypothetical protein
MNFPMTRLTLTSGMKLIAAMPSACIVGRYGFKDGSSRTSDTTIGRIESEAQALLAPTRVLLGSGSLDGKGDLGCASPVSGVHGVCPSTAAR